MSECSAQDAICGFFYPVHQRHLVSTENAGINKTCYLWKEKVFEELLEGEMRNIEL